MSVGIAFSGGGAKAAFHVGVLKAFEEADIEIDFVSGTSSGAIVAALFAAGFSSSAILNIFNFYSRKIIGIDGKSVLKSLINLNKGSRSINKFDNLEGILFSIFNSRGIFDINEVNKKIAICCVEANLGRLVYFGNINSIDCDDSEMYIHGGTLYKIIRASCAYPILFEPSCYKGHILVDGGVMKNLPISILKKMGANKVVAVDVSNDIRSLKSLSMLDVGFRCIDIMGKSSHDDELKKADFVIKSSNIYNVGMLDFERINMLANEGYYEAKKVIEKVKWLCE